MRKVSNLIFIITVIAGLITYSLLFLFNFLSRDFWPFPGLFLIYVLVLIALLFIRTELMAANKTIIAGAITLIFLLPVGVIPGIVCAAFTFKTEPESHTKRLKERTEQLKENNIA